MKNIEILIDKIFEDQNNSNQIQELKTLINNTKPDTSDLRTIQNYVFKKAFKIQQINKPELIKIEEINKLILDYTLFNKNRSEVYFSPGDDCADAIIREIENVSHTIDICVFTISDNRISQAIINAQNQGIQIRIITDNDKVFDKGSDIFIMKDHGIKVKTDHSRHHMHDKFAIFDNQSVITGSFNWTVSASLYNQENLIIERNKKVVKKFIQEFNKLWNKF